MNTLLEQIYRLYFCDTIEEGIIDEVYLLDKAKAIQAKNTLLATLAPEEQGVLTDYLDANANYQEGVAIAHFVAGAQLGAQLAQELKLENGILFSPKS